MIILTWIRSLYKVLGADASPLSIAFAMGFGITLGCIPLTSGLGLFLIACVLVFRVQISAALLALGISGLLAMAGQRTLYVPVGEALLDAGSLHNFWTTFLNLPVVAWLDLDRYAVTGGAVVGIVIGAVLFYPITRLVTGYRRFLHEKVSGNSFFRWLTNFFLVKALRFVFVGK